MNAEPTTVKEKKIIDGNGHSGERLKKSSQFGDVWRRMIRNKRAIAAMAGVAILFLLAVFADFIADYNTTVVKQDVMHQFMKPFQDAAHPLGTDAVGRDIMGRLIHGTRIAVLLGFGGTIISLIIGLLVACVAAYFGGKVDNTIMRLNDVLATIPSLVLSLAICAGLGNGTWQLVVALCAGQIAPMVRMIRSKALSVASMEFFEAGRALGAKHSWMIFRHMIPNIISIVLIQGTSNVSGNIIAGATLSFIGLGVRVPTPEWGSMLSEGLAYFKFYPHLVLIPGIALMLTSLSINTFGDCLRDAFDPQLKGKA